MREDRGMKISRLLLGTAAAAGAAHLVATGMIRALEQLPDPYQREELFHGTPGEVQWIERPDGTRLKTQVAGSGLPVVLAHGYALTSLTWNLVAERLLARGHRVISFDQRGHGDSSLGVEGINSAAMAADYRAVTEHYDVRDGVLVGHSMGTFLALKYLLDHADHAQARYVGAVLAAPTHGLTADDPVAMVRSFLAKQPAVGMLASHPVYGKLALQDAFGAPSPSLVEVMASEIAAANYARISPAVDMLLTEDLGGFLGEISMPVSVIAGSKDRTLPPDQARFIAANLLHGDLVWLEGYGHMLNWEAVGEIVRRVEERQAVVR